MASSPSFCFPASPQSWPQSASEGFNLGQNRWKICTPTPFPQIKGEKMARFGFYAASSLISEGGGVGVCISILFCPRLLVALQKSVTWFCCAPSPPYLENEKTLGTRLFCGGWRSVAVNFGRHIWIVYCRDKEVSQECDKIWLRKYKYLLLLLSNIKEKDKLSYNLTTAWAKWTS